MFSNNLVQILMLFGALQGLILVLVLGSKQHRVLPANKILLSFVLAISFLLGLVSLGGLEIIQIPPRLGYMSDSVGLLYGPLFYFYVLRLLTRSEQKMRWHLAPFALFFAINSLVLIIPSIAGQWNRGFYTFMNSFSLLQLAIYLILSWRIIHRYRQKAPGELSAYQPFQYVVVLILFTASCLLLFSVNYISQLSGREAPFEFLGYELGWLMLSSVTFFLAYYAMRQPEIFRLETSRKTAGTNGSSEDIGPVLSKLQACLKEDKPFLDPELTLEGLARKIGCRKELLSKAINSGLSVNFYRLINEHRIAAFEALAQDPANAHFTHLALALESGFRSKTTFYKAFRELKQTTPSAYLKSL